MHFEREKMKTKPQIGSTVTLKSLSIDDMCHPLYLPDSMRKYHRRTGEITKTRLVTYDDYPQEPQYCVRFQNGQQWWLLESWIEPNTEYNAF